MTISTDIVKWTEILSVEDELLDEQHKKLFDLTNNLLWHCKRIIRCSCGILRRAF
jgi:hypothetical protein